MFLYLYLIVNIYTLITLNIHTLNINIDQFENYQGKIDGKNDNSQKDVYLFVKNYDKDMTILKMNVQILHFLHRNEIDRDLINHDVNEVIDHKNQDNDLNIDQPM